MTAVKQWLRMCFVLMLAGVLCAGTMTGVKALERYSGPDYTIEILPEDAGRERYDSSNASHEASWYTESAVYARMMALQSSYPEGMQWTNADSYRKTYEWHDPEWYTGLLSYTGCGCVGFALIMSDAGFGSDMPVWVEHDVTFSKVRVGDILRINNDTHSVIVLKVNSDSVTIAEGNYNSSIHWGRTLTASQVNDADYLYTRWPGVPAAPTYTVSYHANGGSGAPSPQSKTMGQSLTLSYDRPVRSGWFFVGWAESPTAKTPDYLPGGTFTTDADVTLYAVWKVPDLVIPTSVTSIEDEAFAGGGFTFVKLSDQTVSVGRRAFANCRNLRYVYIPAAITSIDSSAFDSEAELTILGEAGSAAEKIAWELWFDFIPAP